MTPFQIFTNLFNNLGIPIAGQTEWEIWPDWNKQIEFRTSTFMMSREGIWQIGYGDA